ncbi:HD domain-containing protein [Desulfobaculum senezii]|jgi:poly(A) polymerase
MSDPYKDAVGICKTIMRNGYDAYVVNARLQREIMRDSTDIELDIMTDIDFRGLDKLFPEIEHTNEPKVVAALREEGILFRFYPIEAKDGAYPEDCVARMTPRLLKHLEQTNELPASLACPYLPEEQEDSFMGFKDFESGEVCLSGFADDTLKRDYLRGVRALRFAANYHLPIEKNTWLAIIRGVRRILDYVSVSDIMDEWRKVEAENMHLFVRLLFDCQLLHGLIPEVAALSRVSHMVQDEEESVFDHVLKVMKYYPEENAYDWKGTLACMFHDVGKLYTGEYFAGKWHFFQHHRVGAQVTRKILNRLRFDAEDIDLICNLVRYHKRFSFMLTDKGIRRFMVLPDHKRIIEMERAAVKAREGNYTEFNHNMKMMERTETPEEMLEPLLNGNEIMDFTGMQPGPSVGLIRDALLQAQVAGDVTSVPDAVEFVIRYKERENLS